MIVVLPVITHPGILLRFLWKTLFTYAYISFLVFTVLVNAPQLDVVRSVKLSRSPPRRRLTKICRCVHSPGLLFLLFLLSLLSSYRVLSHLLPPYVYPIHHLFTWPYDGRHPCTIMMTTIDAHKPVHTYTQSIHATVCYLFLSKKKTHHICVSSPFLCSDTLRPDLSTLNPVQHPTQPNSNSRLVIYYVPILSLFFCSFCDYLWICDTWHLILALRSLLFLLSRLWFSYLFSFCRVCHEIRSATWFPKPKV